MCARKLRETISQRASQKGKRKEVTPRAKMKALVRKVVDTSAWLVPLLEQTRDPQKQLEAEGWFSLEEKLCFLGREEERSDEMIESITKKINRLPAFMDYNYEIAKELVKVGRFVAYGAGRRMYMKGATPRAAYIVLEGTMVLEDDAPLSTPFQILGSDERSRHRKPLPPLRQRFTKKGPRELVGEEEILLGEKRPVTAFVEETVELICFEGKHVSNFVKPILEKWEKMMKELQKFRLFRFYDKAMLKEVVKSAKYAYYRPKKRVNVIFDEEGKPEYCFFLLFGTCQVIQRLLISKDEAKSGFDKFKLYYFQDQQVYPEWVEAVYMRACYLSKGAFFGIGERLSRHHIYTETHCRFLTLPHKLVYFLRGKLPDFSYLLELMDDIYPSTIDLYLTFVYGRLWYQYSRKTAKKCEVRKNNSNIIHNAPLCWRAVSFRLNPRALEAVFNHRDYLRGRDVYDVIKELGRRRKLKNELDARREYSFARYKSPFTAREEE